MVEIAYGSRLEISVAVFFVFGPHTNPVHYFPYGLHNGSIKSLEPYSEKQSPITRT